MCFYSNNMENDIARRIPQILTEHAVQWRCNRVAWKCNQGRKMPMMMIAYYSADCFLLLTSGLRNRDSKCSAPALRQRHPWLNALTNEEDPYSLLENSLLEEQESPSHKSWEFTGRASRTNNCVRLRSRRYYRVTRDEHGPRSEQLP